MIRAGNLTNTCPDSTVGSQLATKACFHVLFDRFEDLLSGQKHRSVCSATDLSNCPCICSYLYLASCVSHLCSCLPTDCTYLRVHTSLQCLRLSFLYLHVNVCLDTCVAVGGFASMAIMIMRIAGLPQTAVGPL